MTEPATGRRRRRVARASRRTLRAAGVPARPDRRRRRCCAALGTPLRARPRRRLLGGPAHAVRRPRRPRRATTRPSPPASPAGASRGAAHGPPQRLQPAISAPREPGTREGDDGDAPELAHRRPAPTRCSATATSAEMKRRRARRSCAGCSRCSCPPRRCGRSRRRRPSLRGALDPRPHRAAALHDGGEAGRLLHHRARTRPRRVVLLVDVSGSMTPYADALLRFAHAAVRARPRVHRGVHARHPAHPGHARAARCATPTARWRRAVRRSRTGRGGTRLGEVLKAFLDRWGQRGTARGAVVVVPAATAGSAATRRCSASRWRGCGGWRTRVVWVNPHKGRTGLRAADRRDAGGAAVASTTSCRATAWRRSRS